MGEFFHSRKFKVILCIIALLIGIMLYSVTTGGYSSKSSSFFGTIFGPIQEFSSGVSSNVKNTISMLVNAKANYEDNIRLREQLGEVYNDIIDYDKLKQENEEFRKAFGLKEKYPDRVFSSPCTVIARDVNDPYGNFTINQGTIAGIEPNEPVITSTGLVGITYEVAGTYSKVRTILSSDSSVGVYCVRNKDRGVIEGSYENARSGVCKMKYIDKESDIRVGDIVATSGNSGLYPIDILVGTVAEVGIEESGLTLYAMIEPIVDVENVPSVFVITAFNGQGEGYEE